jgi:antagonist of KipI
LPVGAVQVPGGGQPVILLADHQPTGGYTVLACVIRADLRLLTQRAPGDRVRFALTTPAEARAALHAQRATLEQLQAGEDAWAPSAGQGPVQNRFPARIPQAPTDLCR